MDALKEGIKEALKLERDEGITRLSSCFQWTEFEVNDQREYLHQQFVYDNVMHSVRRGLPWATVAQIANLCKELLPELRGLERTEALSMLQTRLSQCHPRLSPSHHTSVCDFMVQTYIHHQCLYQAILKKKVNLKCMHSHLEIHAPPHFPPLSEGTDLKIWKKQQALKKLKEAEAAKIAEINELKRQSKAQITEKLLASLGPVSLKERLDRQELEARVRTFMKTEQCMFREIVSKEIKAIQELAMIKLRLIALQSGRSSSDASGSSKKASKSAPTKKKK